MEEQTEPFIRPGMPLPDREVWIRGLPLQLTDSTDIVSEDRDRGIEEADRDLTRGTGETMLNPKDEQ